jgi:hypothetical protein
LVICDLDTILINTSVTDAPWQYHAKPLAMLQAYISSGCYDLVVLTSRDESLSGQIKTELAKVDLHTTNIYNVDKSIPITKWKRKIMESLFGLYCNSRHDIGNKDGDDTKEKQIDEENKDTKEKKEATNGNGSVANAAEPYDRYSTMVVVHMDHPRPLEEGRSIFVGKHVRYIPIQVDSKLGTCRSLPSPPSAIVITLVEPPGSGKSSVFEELGRQIELTYPQRGPCITLSFDKLAHELKNSSNEERYARFMGDLNKYVSAGRIIFVDCCNDGASILKRLKEFSARCHVIIATFVPIRTNISGKKKAISKPDADYITSCIARCQTRIDTGLMNGSTLVVEDAAQLKDIVSKKATDCVHQITTRGVEQFAPPFVDELEKYIPPSIKSKVDILMRRIASIFADSTTTNTSGNNYYLGLLLPKHLFDTLVQESKCTLPIVPLPHVTIMAPQDCFTHKGPDAYFGERYCVTIAQTITTPNIVVTPVQLSLSLASSSSSTTTTGMTTITPIVTPATAERIPLVPTAAHITIAVGVGHKPHDANQLVPSRGEAASTSDDKTTPISFGAVIVPL